MKSPNFKPIFKPAGENSILVVFGNTIEPQVREQVCGFVDTLKKMEIKGILEIVPSYCSVMIYFKLLRLTHKQMQAHVDRALQEMSPQSQLSCRVLEVPVCYDGVLSPDMEPVLRLLKISKEKLISIHTSKPFLVYMMGFAPGFPYLGGMPFHLPRLSTPRGAVPPGAVGLAGNQTGIYTTETPGEWWLIGRTPLRIFDNTRENPFLLSPGDYVQFTSINISTYFELKNHIAKHSFIPHSWQERVTL